MIDNQESEKKWYEADIQTSPQIVYSDQKDISTNSNIKDNEYSPINEYQEQSDQSQNEEYEQYQELPKSDIEEPEPEEDDENEIEPKLEEIEQTDEAGEKKYIEETRSRLRKIFVFYSSFGSRCNSEYLRPSQFVKMMIDANIVDNTLTQKKLDLLFISATKGKRLIKFSGF